ncbi:hypothetical protein OSB04_011459 [Centaurea solstitialis]|uniref:Reverse transcriptase zinc-binding domain-containing protein n=1 Tax=Centaurea solstitialis TaxID=347529 RepID=A0AA38T9G5_9ASTR|nr:hypothetical protein OSB04_011459 [Centaurea solstitialis]
MVAIKIVTTTTGSIDRRRLPPQRQQPRRPPSPPMTTAGGKAFATTAYRDHHRLCDPLVPYNIGHGKPVTVLHIILSLFVFTRGDLASVEVLKQALARFRTVSGLEPNVSKSEVFFSNVAQNDRMAIINSLNFAPGTFPIRYLGVPLSSVSLRVADFAPLVNKVKMRIHDWKSKSLSFGGRKQLIVSVLQSMQLYWMTVFTLPSGVVHELESCFRDFLWAQGASSKGKCKIAWETVCKPVASGGLGFKRIGIWNRAFLANHIWDIITRRNSLWVNWIWRFCIGTHSFWEIRPNPKWSWTFLKILLLRPIVRSFFSVQLGSGNGVNAWFDNWLPAGSLSQLISYRRFHNAGCNISTVVRDVITSFNGQWPLEWVTNYPTVFNNPPPLLTDGDDMIRWRDIDGNGVIFSIKQAWRSLIGSNPPLSWTKYRTKREVQLHGFPNTWSVIMKHLSDSWGPTKLIQKLALSGAVYFIWRERNRRIFRDTKLLPIQVFKQVQEQIISRMASWKMDIACG